MLLTILAWIVVGVAVGSLASVIVRDTHVGVVGAALVGMLGAVIGGVIFLWLGGSGVRSFDAGSVIAACIAAAILLLLLRLFAANSRGPGRP